MKILFEGLTGNDKLKKILGGDLLSGRQRHAYIIEGNVGSGKHTAALITAAAVACTAVDNESLPLPCARCAACRKVLGGNSPDVIYINKGTRATIGVEQVRNLRSDIYVSANETDRKTYIIEDAHLMTTQAQNAFLLSLEEPPPHVIYLLLTTDSSLLLETVRSRAPIIKTETLKPDTILDHLICTNKNAQKMHKTEPEKLFGIIMSANGSIGSAIDLLDSRKSAAEIEKRRIAIELVTALRTPSIPEAYFAMSTLPQKRDDLTEVLFLAQIVVRDVITHKNSPDSDMCFFTPGDAQIKKLSTKISRHRLCEIYDLLGETSDALKSNSFVTTSLYSLISKTRVK